MVLEPSRIAGSSLGVKEESNTRNGDPGLMSTTNQELHVTIDVKNWSMTMKLYHTAVPCFLSFFITFSASVTAPATFALMSEFNIGRTKALLSGTLYLLGLSFGPLIFAPLSEFIGSWWLYLVTSSCLIAFSGGSGSAQNSTTYLTCRFFCGFLGSAGIAIGTRTIIDVWGMSSSGQFARLFFVCGPFVGPTLGPLAGAYVMHNHHDDWRWTQWLLTLIGAPIWISILFMKETSSRRNRRRIEGSGRFRIAKLATSTLKAAVVRSMSILFTESIAFSVTLYTGYAYAMVFSYFTSAAYVYTIDYGFNDREIGLSYLGVIVGYLLGAIMYVVVQATLDARAARKTRESRPTPEDRLYTAMAGSMFLPIGLFWYAWGANQGGHWAITAASGIPFGIGSFVIFLSSISYLVEAYGAEAAASAVAANGCFRYLLGAMLPLFTIQLYEKLGMHWAGTVFAFLSLALLPIPWILFKFGHLLRKTSRFAIDPSE